MPKSREEGVTLSLASNGGEVEWFARDLLKSVRRRPKILNDEDLEIRDRYPGEFAPTANAHALEEDCQPIVEEMIRKGGAKAIAVASSYGDGSERFPRQPEGGMAGGSLRQRTTSWSHPSTDAVGRHEVLMQYRLNEAVGRPFDLTVNGARMIGSGVFDRYLKRQVLIVDMGGELCRSLVASNSIGALTTKGFRNSLEGKPYKNDRPHSITSRPTSWSTHGFQPNRTASRG